MTPSPDPAFLADVLQGLSAPRKTLPCQWLYDARGSQLFERITALPEYYLTRTETYILQRVAGDLSERIGPSAVLLEYGAGASMKTRILLNALDDLVAYVPVDVSSEFLAQTAEQLRLDYPDLFVRPLVGNFLDPVDLSGLEGRKVGFFPGSTIGNLSDPDIDRFLRNAARSLGPDALFILGYDRVKPLSVLLPAYDDAQGVTANFNLNLLDRINRELGADFDRDSFAHEARWNEDESRIEMHLVSQKSQTVTLDGTDIEFASGETIHTENSRKFTPERIETLCRDAGYAVLETHCDPDALFSVAVLHVGSES
ncbi:MAG: L-histidine N(alpha)-methyltransferase [Litorimonas sp.]